MMNFGENKNKMILEACVESFSEALAAQKAGANRIELCENLAVGGTTPSYGTIKLCCSELKIPVVVMVRSRGGNFVYTKEEFEIMKEDILVCKQLGVSAVIFGLLTSQNQIDISRNRALVELAYPMQSVFHKAFDEVENVCEALEILIKEGFTRILTSGGKTTAREGADVINKLIVQVNNRISIMAAGKITYENLMEHQKIINAHEFHGRRIVNF
jgi:copper homeostasis protein